MTPKPVASSIPSAAAPQDRLQGEESRVVGTRLLAGAWILVTVAVLVISQALTAPGTTSPPVPTSEVAAATDDRLVIVFEETFDGLPMDSALGSPWVISGGDGARIVPLPTSVDRSVRIRSSADGSSAAACRPTGTDSGLPLRAGFEVLIERPPTAAAPVFTLQGQGVRVLAIAIDPSGALVELEQPSGDRRSPAPNGGSNDGDWRLIEVAIDPAQGSATWQVHHAQVAGGSLTIDPGALVDEICFYSPQGVPSAWIAIDDLIVRG